MPGVVPLKRRDPDSGRIQINWSAFGTIKCIFHKLKLPCHAEDEGAHAFIVEKYAQGGYKDL